ERATSGDARAERGASGTARRERVATSGEVRREQATNGDTRRAEREAAYAKNPDQPIVRREHDPSAPAHPHAHIRATQTRARAVPALLQKRRVPEPEKV